ncbi:hypothetical protein B0H13DRAFT_2346032 [Mycena leptocephala]|nr:hypothetical protein B0H13DRAFT_2346032 [Mycena leptocephala]
MPLIVRDSQEIARHLDYPLYQLFYEADAPFAHANDDDSSAEDDQSRPKDEPEDALEKSCEDLVHSPLSSDQRPEHSGLREEIHVSRTFKFLMNVQLVLILFFVFSGL